MVVACASPRCPPGKRAEAHAVDVPCDSVPAILGPGAPFIHAIGAVAVGLDGPGVPSLELVLEPVRDGGVKGGIPGVPKHHGGGVEFAGPEAAVCDRRAALVGDAADKAAGIVHIQVHGGGDAVGQEAPQG